MLTLLTLRSVPLSDLESARILACTDLEQLDRWLVRAASATTVADVLTAP